MVNICEWMLNFVVNMSRERDSVWLVLIKWIHKINEIHLTAHLRREIKQRTTMGNQSANAVLITCYIVFFS